jgi:hypothetical protein
MTTEYLMTIHSDDGQQDIRLTVLATDTEDAYTQALDVMDCVREDPRRWGDDFSGYSLHTKHLY